MIDGSWLVMSQGPQPGQTFMLDRDWLSVGRDPSNDIVINDPQVSRQHARITRQGKMVVIEDVGSTNGSFVNGMRLTGPHVLGNGDVIGLGDGVTLTYYEVGIAADVAETVVGHPGSTAAATPTPMPQPAIGLGQPTPVEQPMFPDMPQDLPPAPPPLAAAQPMPPAYTVSPQAPPVEIPEDEEKKQTWLWVGCGALALILLCIGLAIALWYAPESFWLWLQGMGIPIPSRPF